MVELKIFKTTQTSKYLRHSSPCKKNAGISFLQDRVFTPGDPLPVLHPKPGMCQATGLADFWLFMQILMVAQLVKNLPAMQETGFNSWVRKIPWKRDRLPTPVFSGFPGGSAGKESACNVEDLCSIPGLGRSPGEGNSYPLHYSGLENSKDCIVHGVAKSQTQLSNFQSLIFRSRIWGKDRDWRVCQVNLGCS